MIKIALTGPSGSGKGYVSALFEQRGIPCLDTDLVVHRLYENPSFVSRLCSVLKEDISSETGAADRRKLGNIVYQSKEKMNALLAEVYPKVRQVCKDFLTEAQKKGCVAAMVDAPQLFEAGFESDFDFLIAVTAPKELRIQRIMMRDHLSFEQALVRIRHQKTEEEYINRCHFTIDNGENGTAEKDILRILDSIGILQ